MNAFLDANILVAVLNKEYPLYTNAARLLSLQGQRKCILHTSAVCLAIAFYFAEKKHGSTVARKKISLLARHLAIADCGKKETEAAISNPGIHDFEDGLEYYAAIHAGCTCIVTEDRNDFYFSDVAVLDAASFLRQRHMPSC